MLDNISDVVSKCQKELTRPYQMIYPRPALGTVSSRRYKTVLLMHLFSPFSCTLRGMNTHGEFCCHFYKEDNFCDRYSIPLLKKVYSKREKKLLPGE